MDTPSRSFEVAYTEAVAGPSPVPPTEMPPDPFQLGEGVFLVEIPYFVKMILLYN